MNLLHVQPDFTALTSDACHVIETEFWAMHVVHINKMLSLFDMHTTRIVYCFQTIIIRYYKYMYCKHVRSLDIFSEFSFFFGYS